MGNTPQPPPLEINHLSLRAAQAPIAACLIKEFANALGWSKALELAAAAIRTDAFAAGRRMAEQGADNTLQGLARLVREVWSKEDAMQVTFLEETERSLAFDVTRCGYAELYRTLGILELGYCLSCSRDEPFVQGFNPRIRLARTQTIMQGAPFCDFRFEAASSPDDP
ncbi:MAG: L-2-amino-thiazoline-4-carboxylic acid hydrolase [Desulfobacterales bacterium]|jgi:hypothetical protein|nr:L-2-amino-thiazoline-4-carboxylic acid hydrolase [Desulfobacterales bacterium]